MELSRIWFHLNTAGNLASQSQDNHKLTVGYNSYVNSMESSFQILVSERQI
jgi:hypothetical protein